MRYAVMYPIEKTIDPRPPTKLSSMDDLNMLATAFSSHKTQAEAARVVRERHPDAIAIPLMIELGSGVQWMMGVIGDPEKVVPESLTAEDRWPFVALVLVQPEDDIDRRLLRKHGFKPTADDRVLWACPVPAAPPGPRLVLQAKVALRVQGFPKQVPVQLGHDANGNPMIFAAPIDGEGISFTFDKSQRDELLRAWLGYEGSEGSTT